jgi:hypothetical protein
MVTIPKPRNCGWNPASARSDQILLAALAVESVECTPDDAGRTRNIPLSSSKDLTNRSPRTDGFPGSVVDVVEDVGLTGIVVLAHEVNSRMLNTTRRGRNPVLGRRQAERLRTPRPE